MFRAYDAERERQVAVKLFKLDLPPERVHQLVAALERAIVAELSHPAMAVPLAAGISDVSAYLAVEYVAAESLDLALREYGPAPAADAVRVAAQLAGALDFAAVVDVFHGSLHPRDALISANETRLTGIGIARALESAGVAAPVRRPYSAPERVAGGSWDRRADIFSLAALTHELLWGRRVSGTGSHAADGLTAIDGGDLKALQDLFACALAEDPRDRFATALEFADALTRAFAGVAVDARAAAARPKAAGRAPEPPAPVVARPEPAAPIVVRPEPPAPRLPLEAPEIVAALPLRDALPSDDDDVLTLQPPVARYQDMEPEPEVPLPEVRAHDDFDRVAEPAVTVHEPPPISVLEQSRSAVWPLMAALAIGLAIGFAGGYGIGSRDHGTAPAATLASADPQPATPPAGRDATDVPVTEPAKPPIGAPAAAPAPAPARDNPPVRPKPDTATGRTGAATDRPANDRAASDRAANDRAASDRSARAQADRAPAPIRTRDRVAANRTATRPLPPPPPPRAAERPAATPASGTAGRFVGSLNVESRPTGARVFLDGKLIGNTPLVMPSVPAGEHAVRLEYDGYRRWSSSVRVVASERNRVTASLER